MSFLVADLQFSRRKQKRWEELYFEIPKKLFGVVLQTAAGLNLISSCSFPSTRRFPFSLLNFHQRLGKKQGAWMLNELNRWSCECELGGNYFTIEWTKQSYAKIGRIVLDGVVLIEAKILSTEFPEKYCADRCLYFSPAIDPGRCTLKFYR